MSAASTKPKLSACDKALAPAVAEIPARPAQKGKATGLSQPAEHKLDLTGTSLGKVSTTALLCTFCRKSSNFSFKAMSHLLEAEANSTTPLQARS